MPARRCEQPNDVLQDDQPPRRDERQLVNKDDGRLGRLSAHEDVALDGRQDALLRQLRNADVQELVQRVSID